MFPLLLVLCTSSLAQPVADIFQQRLDHYSAEDLRTFPQRYFLASPLNSSMTGPLLFYVGAESETGEWAVLPETFVQYAWAQELDGLLVAAEHR